MERAMRGLLGQSLISSYLYAFICPGVVLFISPRARRYAMPANAGGKLAIARRRPQKEIPFVNLGLHNYLKTAFSLLLLYIIIFKNKYTVE
jgi:hypothetical protein